MEEELRRRKVPAPLMNVCAAVVSGERLRVPVDVYVAPDAIETVAVVLSVNVPVIFVQPPLFVVPSSMLLELNIDSLGISALAHLDHSRGYFPIGTPGIELIRCKGVDKIQVKFSLISYALDTLTSRSTRNEDLWHRVSGYLRVPA